MSMEDQLLQKYSANPRCCVCNKLGARNFPVLNDSHTPRVPLCNRHRNEQEKIGWALFCEKYDFVENILHSLGFEFRNSHAVFIGGEKKWPF